MKFKRIQEIQENSRNLRNSRAFARIQEIHENVRDFREFKPFTEFNSYSEFLYSQINTNNYHCFKISQIYIIVSLSILFSEMLIFVPKLVAKVVKINYSCRNSGSENALDSLQRNGILFPGNSGNIALEIT